MPPGGQAPGAGLFGRGREESREVPFGAVEGARGAGPLRLGGGERGVGAQGLDLGGLADGEELARPVELEGERRRAGLLRGEDLAAGERSGVGRADPRGDRLLGGREGRLRGAPPAPPPGGSARGARRSR